MVEEKDSEVFARGMAECDHVSVGICRQCAREMMRTFIARGYQRGIDAAVKACDEMAERQFTGMVG